jgi:N-acetylmuramoyl-L-alanine amidase
VRAGRLDADAQLAKVFYGRQPGLRGRGNQHHLETQNTAWLIAGEDFDSSSTVYQFPDGRLYTGDQMTEQVGWDRIPAKTVVLLNQTGSLDELKNDGPVKTIADGITAWSLAGRSYNHHHHLFSSLRPNKNGSMISDWDDLPVKTRLIIGYKGPFPGPQGSIGLSHRRRRLSRTPNHLLPAFQAALERAAIIKDFSRLQAGTLVFLPAALYSPCSGHRVRRID